MNDFSKRILCSDGACIGVVNEQGICKVCGKPSKERSLKVQQESKDQDQSYISGDDFRLLVERVKNFANLGDNWDDENALPVTNSAITRAIRLLHVLRRRGFSMSKYDWEESFGTGEINEINIIFNESPLTIGAEPDGGISFGWCRYINLFDVLIPPEENAPILYEAGYIEEYDSDGNINPEYLCTDRGYTSSHEIIADKLKEGAWL